MPRDDGSKHRLFLVPRAVKKWYLSRPNNLLFPFPVYECRQQSQLLRFVVLYLTNQNLQLTCKGVITNLGIQEIVGAGSLYEVVDILTLIQLYHIPIGLLPFFPLILTLSFQGLSD